MLVSFSIFFYFDLKFDFKLEFELIFSFCSTSTSPSPSVLLSASISLSSSSFQLQSQVYLQFIFNFTLRPNFICTSPHLALHLTCIASHSIPIKLSPSIFQYSHTYPKYLRADPIRSDPNLTVLEWNSQMGFKVVCDLSQISKRAGVEGKRDVRLWARIEGIVSREREVG